MYAKYAPTIRLTVKTFDAEGRQLTEETKDNDIFLYNWAALIAALLKAAFCANVPGTYAWKNLVGTARTTVSDRYCGYAYPGGSSANADSANGGFVQIGGGNNAPLISDYCLQTFIAEATPTPPDIIVNGNLLKIVFSTTFSFPAETTIGETGIRLVSGLSDDITATGKYLITRDIFTPATVPANGTVSIQHELWFNGTP